MPAKYNGLLEQAHLEDVNLRSALWQPIRGGRWGWNAARPEFFGLRQSKPNVHKLRPTAWLDGLRGFAAFLVYLHHNQLWAHGTKGELVLGNSFGYEGRRYFATLPFVRIFFSGGHFAVSIFFVISGYVLSVKSLGLIHAGQTASVADNVSSALFRRWIRLYLPIIVVTFMWLSFRHSTKMWIDAGSMEASYGKEILQWYRTFKNYSFVFSENIYPFVNQYHFHLWSIPIEFKGSIIIYTLLSALSRCSRNARLWCEAGLMFYFLYVVDGWYGALFVSGMFLCDLDLLARDNQLPRFLAALSDFKEMIFFHLFILSLYLAGVPSLDGQDDKVAMLSRSPGWKWLSYLTPQAVFDAKWFFLFWAAFLCVAAISRLPMLKYFFETSFCQYLARISFALYLVHGPVMWSLGDRLYAAVGLSRSAHANGIPGWVNKFPISTKGPMGLDIAFWVLQLVLIPFTFYAAEMVTKLIDEPSVKFANWIYRSTLSGTVPTRK